MPRLPPYPLSGFPGQRQIWSWISFDVANQSFTLIINTLLFSIFFSAVVVRDDALDDRLWAVTYGASMLLCALVSPVVGAMADERAWKKAGLIGTGILCGLLTCGLAFIRPGQIALAMALYIPANLTFALGENFLASFLPALARPQDMGRVSAFSWGCAYTAALLLLILTAAAMLGTGRMNPGQWRPFFVFAGAWFLVFLIPTLLWLREPAAPARTPGDRNVFLSGFSRLVESLRAISGHRDLALLLAASLFYGTGTSVVIFFASKLAAEYGFTQVRLVLFIAVITVSGILGTLVPMKYQDRVGHRRTTLGLLVLWLVTTAGFAGYAFLRESGSPAGASNGPMWLVGNLLGFGLGSLGAANRAFVGYLAPKGREAETFGLWGMVFKLSAIMTFPFAWMKDVAGTPAALLLLAGFVAVGLALTLLVNEHRGRAAAVAGSA
ncbi:MAG: MFS transporter [Verrucomicrobiae bacterium]|nr:MFS transporter [Verrucomicrobiae bacterium]